MEADALRSRIRDKQDASQQRLESHLQAIREKATGPRQATTSESQDQNPKEQDVETVRLDQERKEREKQKMIRKKARKLKQKLLLAGIANPMSDDTITTSDTYLNHTSSKVYRAISSIRHIIAPLLAEIKLDQPTNGVEDEGECSANTTNKKKKKQTKNDVKNEPEKENEEKKPTDTDTKAGASGAQSTKPDAPPEAAKESKKKKRNKKKNAEDKPPACAAGSVCSSVSDMSRASCRSDKKTKVDLDLPFLEKQMNELFRLMERYEKNNMAEKAAVQRYQALKVVSQTFAVAAEKQDLNPPISPKCLTTAVTLVSRVIMNCTALATQLLTTNTCIHQATLLAKQLEKDLGSDLKEAELTKQLADCLSVVMDAVLTISRHHEKVGTKDKQGLAIVAEVRGRAHQLISYLCLSGVVANAENAGEVRETIQTLLTLCADLCHPFVADVGSEREQARQALRIALGKEMCGSRAEFCMLFAAGASLNKCTDTFVKAARTTHLLKAIAEMDHTIVQEAFGEGGWPLEFRAAVARLINQHAPNEQEAPRTSALRLRSQRLDTTLSETMLLDLITLVGYVIVNNQQLQDTICEGWSVTKTLCTLPANWFVSEARSNALLPTLIALADRPQSAAAIASEMSMSILEEFLENPVYQKIKLIKIIKQGRAKKNSGKK